MKTIYRGFEISVKREQALGGWDNLYFYIMRIEDGWFLEDSFSTGEDSIADMTKYLKQHVDDFFENPEDYEDEQ